MNKIYEPEFVKQLFNQMSGSYERMNYITSFGFSIRWRRQFLNKLGKSDEKLNVIDLLSGLGENWTYLRNNFPNSSFTALDFSDEMIVQSRNKGNKVFKNQLNLLCEDVLESQLESNFFDIISCAYGLKTFNSQQLDILAKEVSRILKHKGKFSFVEVSKPKNKILYSAYRIYLGKVIPVLGKLFLGNPNDYKMLWIYTENFENCNRVKEIFEKHHLKVDIESYFYSCATGIHGEKI
ncbi:class I SAM-dependent methyltransferase [Chryseobacterium sp. GP-SGM7]|uniref:class I SAM-dependent methyltransferase n=1 Tax=Chryseobacterium sp. GP-SGM7 TaxID=3411323 RepID=UPI003B93F730